MLSILVMANDSLLADAIVSTLEREIDLDVVRLTHRELGKGNQHAVAIVVDEGEPDDESVKVAELFRDHNPSLVILISLKSRNIYIYESYQLVNPDMEQIVHVVREFSRMNLKKSFEEANVTHEGRMTGDLFGNVQAMQDKGPQKGISGMLHSLFNHYLRRKDSLDVTVK